MSAGLTTASPSPDMVETSLMNPVGSFGTSVSILLAASSSRCFRLFLPTQKNFDGSGIGGRNFSPAIGTQQLRAFGRNRKLLQRRDRLRPAGQRDLDRGSGHRAMQRIRGGRDVDDLIAADDAETGFPAERLIGKCRKTHLHFPPGICTSLSFTSLLHLATSALM